MTVDSANYDSFSMDVTGRDLVTFYVTGCYNLHIALSEIPGVLHTLTYEIILGANGNSRSVIKYGIGGEEIASSETQDVVNCQEKRAFWINWGDRPLWVGRGLQMDPDSAFLVLHGERRLDVVNSLAVKGGERGTGDGDGWVATWQFFTELEPTFSKYMYL